MLFKGSVDKQKMGDQVLNILRTSIMQGKVEAGFHLKETVLSKELGVSRGPIREALVQLENEGLVMKPSNGRTIVNGFSNKDIENLYNTRILIEKYAISNLTEEAIERGIKELFSYVKLMEEALERGERDVNSDLFLHFMLVDLTGNKSLIQAWKSLHGSITGLIQVTSDFAVNQQEIFQEHLRIVQYLSSFEICKAQAELEYHLLAAREFYKEAVIHLKRNNKNKEN